MYERVPIIEQIHEIAEGHKHRVPSGLFLVRQWNVGFVYGFYQLQNRERAYCNALCALKDIGIETAYIQVTPAHALLMRRSKFSAVIDNTEDSFIDAMLGTGLKIRHRMKLITLNLTKFDG